MSYDWTKHIRTDTLSRRPGGVEAGGRAYLGKAAPQGLRFTAPFYLQWAFDNVIRSLSYATESEREAIYDLLMWMASLDEDIQYLTAYQRRDYSDLVQPSPAPYDGE